MPRGFILRLACALAFTAAANVFPVPPAAAQEQHPQVRRDGSRDFDFEIGTWKTHLRRLLHPLTGSKEWGEYDGTSVVRKVWGGNANLVELEVHGAEGTFTGLNFRLYNPK